MTEQAMTIDCDGAAMVAILHRPGPAVACSRRGVLMVVGGGPQYRVGGHRQLTLWARQLCEHGFPVLRFDYRGMGDSSGLFQGFLSLDDDIRCAIDRFVAEVPDLDEIVLWGECDAASAILLYASRDSRVKAAVLLNPWVRTDAVKAKAILRFYYLQRLMQPSFWKKLVSGRFNPAASLVSALGLWRKSRQQRPLVSTPVNETGERRAGVPIPRSLPLTEGMLLGLNRFEGPLMLVLSGRDLIAREFETVVASSSGWQQALTRRALCRHDMPDADHTFSSARQRGQVADWALAWLQRW